MRKNELSRSRLSLDYIDSLLMYMHQLYIASILLNLWYCALIGSE